MKTQKQVLVPMNGDWEEVGGGRRIGSVFCPYCEARVDVVRAMDDGKMGAAQPYVAMACTHARGVVDAGAFKMALHFEGEAA